MESTFPQNVQISEQELEVAREAKLLNDGSESWDSLIIDGYYSQLQFDIFPIYDESESSQPSLNPLSIELGKRSQPESDLFDPSIVQNRIISSKTQSYIFEYLR